MKGKASVLPVILSLLVLLSLLSLAVPVLAQSSGDTTIPASVFHNKTLNVSMEPTDFSFYDSHASQAISIDVTNPTNDPMDVYVAIYKDRQWNVVKKLGSLEGGARKAFTYSVDFTYGGKTNETDQFGIAGTCLAQECV